MRPPPPPHGPPPQPSNHPCSPHCCSRYLLPPWEMSSRLRLVCSVVQHRPRPPGEEAVYKYPTRRGGYHPAHAGSGGVEIPPHLVFFNTGSCEFQTLCPALPRPPSSTTMGAGGARGWGAAAFPLQHHSGCWRIRGQWLTMSAATFITPTSITAAATTAISARHTIATTTGHPPTPQPQPIPRWIWLPLHSYRHRRSPD